MTGYSRGPHRPVGQTGINRSVDAALAGRAMQDTSKIADAWAMTTSEATHTSSPATRIGYLIAIAVLVGLAIENAIVALKHMGDADWVPMTIALVFMSGTSTLAELVFKAYRRASATGGAS